jgi:hypothetical protein
LTEIPFKYLILYILMIAFTQLSVSLIAIYLIVEWKKRKRKVKENE